MYPESVNVGECTMWNWMPLLVEYSVLLGLDVHTN